MSQTASRGIPRYARPTAINIPPPPKQWPDDPPAPVPPDKEPPRPIQDPRFAGEAAGRLRVPRSLLIIHRRAQAFSARPMRSTTAATNSDGLMGLDKWI